MSSDCRKTVAGLLIHVTTRTGRQVPIRVRVQHESSIETLKQKELRTHINTQSYTRQSPIRHCHRPPVGLCRAVQQSCGKLGIEPETRNRQTGRKNLLSFASIVRSHQWPRSATAIDAVSFLKAGYKPGMRSVRGRALEEISERMWSVKFDELRITI